MISHYSKNNLIQEINKYPLLSKYLMQSLLERFNTDNWFENRFIRSIFTEGTLQERYEKIFKGVDIEYVINNDKIFSECHGNAFDYDAQLFDTLAEIELIRWARQNGYKYIEKIKRHPSIKTPDFYLKKDMEITAAEAKHFRVRDYLIDFVYDRLAGIYLVTHLYNQMSFTIKTTRKYEDNRDNLTKLPKEDRKPYIEKIRQVLTPSILNNFKSQKCSEMEILNGLILIRKRNNYTHTIDIDNNYSHSIPLTFSLMSEKIEGNLLKALNQIVIFIDSPICNEEVMKALVFFSGTSQQEPEWDTFWDVLNKFKDDDTWKKLNDIHEKASNAIHIPFDLIIGMGDQLKYDYFPWVRPN